MIRALFVSAALVLLPVAVARAADFSGNWQGTIEANGEKVHLVYDLKAEGNKLIGTVEGPAGKLNLEDGKIDGDKISFQVTFGDIHIQHEGKLVDGKIKIISHMPQQGDHEYTVARVLDLNGKWKGDVKFPSDGQTRTLVYDLKVEGDKLTGSVTSPRGTIEMSDAKLSDDGFSFVTKRGDAEIKHDVKLVDGKLSVAVHTNNGDTEYKLARMADIDGPWQTKITLQDGTDLDLKYDYKTDGEKLTGTVEGPAGQLEIKDGKIDGDKITYKLTIGDNEVSYEGTAVDGAINLKSHGGPFGDRQYTLKRPVGDLAGAWESTFKSETGEDMPLKFDFKVDGDKLTGSVKSGQGDGEISNGKINGKNVSFDVNFQGNTITHKGSLEGNEIKLKVEGFGTAWELTLKRAK